MNYYPNYNQFYTTGQSIQQNQQLPKVQPIEQQYNQFAQPNQFIQPQSVYKTLGLQGKSVDSIDVVKAMDIPLDFSISYFPLTDGSAIVTKQLQTDGTSKTVVYKPIDTENSEDTLKYITEDKFKDFIIENENSVKDFKNDMKEIKRQVEDITSDISDIKKSIKDRKEK